MDDDHIVTPVSELGPSEVDRPVTVRTFAREDERMPVRAFLEAEGIACIQPDSNALSIDPGLFGSKPVFSGPTSCSTRFNSCSTRRFESSGTSAALRLDSAEASESGR